MGKLGVPNIVKLQEKGKTKQLLKILKRNKDSSTTQAAIRALGELGCEYAIEPISKALNEFYGFHPEQSIIAASALGKIGHKNAVPFLKQALERKEFDKNIREILFLKKQLAIGKSGMGMDLAEQEAKVWIEQKEHLLTAVRMASAQALGNIKDISVVKILIDALRDEHPLVCLNAADALAKHGELVVNELKHVFPTSHGKTLKMANRAMAQIEDNSWQPPINEIVEELVTLVEWYLALDVSDALLLLNKEETLDIDELVQTSTEQSVSIIIGKYNITDPITNNQIIEKATKILAGKNNNKKP